MSVRRLRVLGLLALNAVMAGALCASAAAASSACVLQPVKTPFQERVASAIETRKLFGLPRGRAHVQALERSRRARARYVEGIPFAMSLAEWRYFRQRERIESQSLTVGSVLRSMPGVSGGISIEDDWPRSPYVAVRVARRLTSRQRERIVRRADRVRIIRVRRSLRELISIQDAIDWDALAADGVHVVSTSWDIDRNRVRVEFHSPRPDAEQLLTERYGRAIHVVRLPATTPLCVDPDGFRLAPDGVTLTLLFETSSPDTTVRPDVREQPDRVLVGVVEDVGHGLAFATVRREVTLTLATPLADREVRTITTRRPVPRR